ncbi:uncharacterized protein C2orf73 homolog [Dromiciops gliroides]|uniref:uncharacterized protein C2orf73 homolog n=1 Tax=Dromiciops gliroides TaxID=33562 RepID=UPI001CC6F64A|nr:uncharacterized protein C2orf73 homolog [Dromiciops gliroides]
MTQCQVFESPMNNKKTDDNLASSKEDGKDNCKISDVHLPDIVERKEKNKCEKEAEKTEQRPENPCPRRPHMVYAKFIRTNARFFNEPVCYIEHPDMRNIQEDWWSHEEILNHHCVPSYDSQSTQRSDFKIPACQLVLPNKHCRKQKPACGIVPLAISDSLPVTEKKISDRFPFIHQFRKKLPPKHHGAFLRTDIKRVRGSLVPKGTEVFQGAPGSHLPEQSKAEKGNSMTSTTTSPSLCQHCSQRSPISECHLSETDYKEETVAYPTPPRKEQKSPGIAGTAEVNFILPTRQEPLYPPIKQNF